MPGARGHHYHPPRIVNGVKNKGPHATQAALAAAHLPARHPAPGHLPKAAHPHPRGL